LSAYAFGAVAYGQAGQQTQKFVSMQPEDVKYAEDASSHKLRAGENIVKYWPLARFFGWYDFVLNVESDSTFLQQLAGHIETGRDSVTDPAIAD